MKRKLAIILALLTLSWAISPAARVIDFGEIDIFVAPKAEAAGIILSIKTNAKIIANFFFITVILP